MAEVRYIPAPPRPPRPLPPPRPEPSEAETRYKEARRERKAAHREGEERSHSPRARAQAGDVLGDLVAPARLLAIAEQHARELLNVGDEREMSRRLDAIVRDTLSEIAEMPLKVSHERWLEKLDGSEATPPTKRRPHT
jgi:hypothetical protein